MTEHTLITGGAGFIGSHLAQRLHAAGHTVTVLDALIPQVHGSDPERTSSLLRAVRGVADVVHGTVTSADDIRRALEGATSVVHFAAETGTGQSMYEIGRYVDTNVGGTATLLDVLGEGSHDVRRLVVASSRSIYGEGAYRTADGRTVFPPSRQDGDLAAGEFDVTVHGEGAVETVPTGEDARLHPVSVYGVTKLTQESLVLTAAPAMGIEPVALRYQNVYGPGQSLRNPYTGILSIFSTRIRQGKEIDIFEDGLESRDFVYIDDVVDATYRAVVSDLPGGGVFNVGTGVPVTVLEVVEELMDAFGQRVPTSVSGRYRVGDIRHCVADTRRAREELGFDAQIPFAQGVRMFVDWVRGEPIEVDGYESSLAEMAQRRILR
ncbi:MAG: NAD-dependent epimerase/dehydratase family protein [Mycetocola sp.]